MNYFLLAILIKQAVQIHANQKDIAIANGPGPKLGALSTAFISNTIHKIKHAIEIMIIGFFIFSPSIISNIPYNLEIVNAIQ